jgi:hypothetical protein
MDAAWAAGDTSGNAAGNGLAAIAPAGKSARLEIAKKRTLPPIKIPGIKATNYQWNQQNSEKSEKIGTGSKPTQANDDLGHIPCRVNELKCLAPEISDMRSKPPKVNWRPLKVQRAEEVESQESRQSTVLRLSAWTFDS